MKLSGCKLQPLNLCISKEKAQMFRPSKYNTYSNISGDFYIFNTLYGCLFQVEENIFSMMKGGDIADIANCAKRVFLEYGVICSDAEEEKKISEIYFKRNLLSYVSAQTILELTLCPTLGCNFTCSYCFENSQDDMSVMDNHVFDGIKKFVSDHDFSELSITWYGGEPLIYFDKLYNMSKYFMEKYRTSFYLVTNGYLISRHAKEIIEISPKYIQITLDGVKDTHDARRKLKSGQGTFNVIMQGILELLNCGYTGAINIRVNIDSSNIDRYGELEEYIKSAFGNFDNVFLNPGVVDTVCNCEFDSCVTTPKDWIEFSNAHTECSIAYEKRYNMCTATSINSYVIGPHGEIYKCWEDVGKESMIVGDVFSSPYIKNLGLASLYMYYGDPINSDECLNCHLLPVCGGGCANRRYLYFFHNKKTARFCSEYKGNEDFYIMGILNNIAKKVAEKYPWGCRLL